MQETNRAALFPLGQIVATPGALAALAKAGQTPLDFLTRHVRGDWGELDPHDQKENELGLKRGFRLLSSYRTSSCDTKVWVITEADRSVTCFCPKSIDSRKEKSEPREPTRASLTALAPVR